MRHRCAGLDETKQQRYGRELREDMERWEEYERTGQSISQAEMAKWMRETVAGRDVPCPK